MPRKKVLAKIKENPERYKKLQESKKRYNEEVKKDKVKYEGWKEGHRQRQNKYYHEDKEKFSKKRKEFYKNLSKEKKEEKMKKIKISVVERRRRIVKEWGAKCQRCSYSTHQEILQFDHKDPEYRRTNNIKKLVGDHMLKEVEEHPERFNLLCPNCHRLKTMKEVKALWEEKRRLKEK